MYRFIFLFFQNWVAYDVLPGSWNITERGKLHFSGLGAPKKENNYAFCQVGKTNGLLYVFDESLFSLVQLKGKRVSPISTRHYSGQLQLPQLQLYLIKIMITKDWPAK